MFRLAAFIVVFSFACLVVPARSAELITIYGSDNIPPLSWNENAKPKGILVDILHEIELRTDLSFNIQLIPWKRAYILGLEGRGGVVGLSMNQERLRLFDYSNVIYYDEMCLVVLKGHEFPYATFEDLRQKIVGVTRGASYGEGFEMAKKDIFIPSEDTNSVCRLRMLLAGRIDAALIGPGEASLRYLINRDPTLKANQDKFVILDTPFNLDPNFIGFSKAMKRNGTLSKINQALDAMWWSGIIRRIESRY